MNYHKIAALTIYELKLEFKRVRYWLSIILFPTLFWGAISLRHYIYSGIARESISSMSAASAEMGVYDGSKVLSEVGQACRSRAQQYIYWGLQMYRTWNFSFDGIPPRVRCYSNLEEAISNFKMGNTPSLLVIPDDFYDTGELKFYSQSKVKTFIPFAFSNYLQNLFVNRSDLSKGVKSFLLGNEDVKYYTLDDANQIIDQKDSGDSLSGKIDTEFDLQNIVLRFISLFIALCVLNSFTLGERSTQNERASHVIETLLTSLSPKEYLLVRLITVAVSTQLKIAMLIMGFLLPFWLGSFANLTIIIMKIFSSHVLSVTVLPLTILLVGGAIAMVVTLGSGVGMYTNAPSKGKGSIGGLISSVLSLLAGYSIMYLPDGPLLNFLSYLPPASGVFMVYRYFTDQATLFQVGCAFGGLLLGVYLSLALSAKLVRLSLSLDANPFRALFSTPRLKKNHERTKEEQHCNM